MQLRSTTSITQLRLSLLLSTLTHAFVVNTIKQKDAQALISVYCLQQN